ncbi:MAG: NAD-glutamate dehydrogenase [Hyphomonadaceae bacterium]
MNRIQELAFNRDVFFAAAERQAPSRPGNPGINALTPFLEQYRSDAFTEDFLSLTTEDAVSLALDLWSYDHETPPETLHRIRVRRATGFEGKPLRLEVAEIVGPDMAFLVDSAIAACHDARLEIRAVLHPVIKGERGDRSLIQIHLPVMDEIQRQALQDSLEETFQDVGVVNADHVAMRERMEGAMRSVASLPQTRERSADEIREAEAFLSWLAHDRFVFLGARDYYYARGTRGEFAAEEPEIDEASGLGILRDPARRVLSRSAEPSVITPAIRDFLSEPSLVVVAKASFRSRVHRRAYSDYIGVKRYGPDGQLLGETRFVGLFTSDAYTMAADTVPLIRHKIARVRARLVSASRFSGKRLDAMLLSYPRDELFQISEEDLSRIAMGVMHLQIRPRTRLFIRRDRFDRYVSALLYTPRDSFNSDLREKAHHILADAYAGRMTAFHPFFGEGPLARVQFIIGLNPGHPEPDEDALDLQMRQLFESWEDTLARLARSTMTHTSAVAHAAFTAAYKEAFSPEEGLTDLSTIIEMGEDRHLRVRVSGNDDAADIARAKIYHRGSALELAEIVPVMERMGLRVRAEGAYPIRKDGPRGEPVWVHEITMDVPEGRPPLGINFERAFEAVWARETENDGFNAIVVALDVDWRMAALLRTLCRYRSQSGLDPSEAVQVAAMCDYPEITASILKMFAIHFDAGMPGDIASRKLASAPLEQRIVHLLERVSALDADRVLRRLLTLVKSIQRTNFYLVDEAGRPDPYISIKVASQEALPLPEPKPYREIFVWSPEVEGVHLRFGPVARGGLRWSDRRDDFRTEVLGLVKAQQVKNAVIVPVGSKGGFFPKMLPAGGTREEIQAAGISAYKTFIRALLQLTDNLVDGKPVHAPRLVTWDGDDPYLVVAADKGTSTFSDIANGISQEADFWLGDAFASGGSAGYDHKKMGITARGAWEAVKRHFRELGHDTQSEPFDVIGVGDMSGDVFGNGMLLSKTIRLVAAFDHRHIFLDPNPENLEACWNERKRMFELPRSSWADYDASMISKGGGVFERSAKTVALSDEVRALTGLAAQEATPAELISALLSAETDLLWFGGIGTYVKASHESNGDVGDKANDTLRVDARDLKARVIGEGANLAVTQAGRIEFARKGGRVNTDAIDNSAGVDSSDHEVNIKILLSEAIATGDLAASERNDLLASMTDEVAHLVLQHNYDQTGALSMMEFSAVPDLDSHERFIETLEARGKLNRHVEGLPPTEAFRQLRERALGLTRPELSVLMAYAKIDLFAELVDSRAPDDAALESLLVTYFPDELRRFHRARNRHRLRREIIATRLSNRIVNMTGPTFAAQKRDEGLDPGLMALAFEAAYAIFGFEGVFAEIAALDGKAPAAAQTLMQAETCANLRIITGAFLSDARLSEPDALGDFIARYRDKVGEVRKFLPDVISPIVSNRVEARAERYRMAGAPSETALNVAIMRALASARETVDIAERTGWPLYAAAHIQHQVGVQLGVDRMRSATRDLEPHDHWDRLALQRVADDLPRQQIELAVAAVEAAKRDGVPPNMVDRDVARRVVESWLAPRREIAERLIQPAGNFEHSGLWSLAKLVLLGDALRDFVYASRSSTPGGAT